jgi:hypothetical protein
MKKIVITLVVLGCAFGVKAQQFPLDAKVQLQQSPGLLKQQLLKPDSLNRNSFLLKQPDSLGAKPVFRVNVTGKVNIDNMPIARMPGNANMPVMQTDRTGYNMPVVGMNQPEVYTMQKPGVNSTAMPWLGGKAPIYFDLKKYPNNTPPAGNSNK